MNQPELKKLIYKIHSASSSTENYPPRKILQNRPSDPSSRWSSDTNCHPQFIMLQMKPSIVHTITFGKYEKMHVCNVKKFEIYGGLEESGMLKLCEGDLRNDSTPETFPLRTMVGGKVFPVKFIKIVPIQTWGSSFNYSVWYVELNGTDEEEAVLPCLDTVVLFRQETAFRMCLKMFRDLGLDECFETLRKTVTVPLEHPFITDLYNAVVKQGAFEDAEHLIDQATEKGLLTNFVAGQQAVPVWTEIRGDPQDACPGMRGGHQMVLDPASQMIYLFGGWDGARDLADFWQYDMRRKKWILISTDTEQEDGPSARSCHKMVIDSDNQTIFLIGRYVDATVRTSETLKNDFFMYDILRKRWTEISTDTHAEGGPKVLFDHQMALDAMKRTIYIFGGRMIEKKTSGPIDQTTINGLYSYHIPTSTWRRIQPDEKSSESSSPRLKPRMGHCIIFHPVKRLLYVIGGKYNQEPVKDMVAFHVDKETVHTVGNAASGDTMPVGLTQRATLDLELDEIYVYFGLTKDRESLNSDVQNSLWVFDVATNKWSVCPAKTTCGASSSEQAEPSPRYAHQIVYDPVHKLHYLFGGNPSIPSSNTKVRLDDFWEMKLVRLHGTEINRRAKYVLRKQKFRELCANDPLHAVQYLQVKVSQMVDPKSSTEMEEFHDLPNLLFCGFHSKRDAEQSGLSQKAFTTQQSRVEVFSKLCQFFPDDMVPPRHNLTDLVLP